MGTPAPRETPLSGKQPSIFRQDGRTRVSGSSSCDQLVRRGDYRSASNRFGRVFCTLRHGGGSGRGSPPSLCSSVRTVCWSLSRSFRSTSVCSSSGFARSEGATRRWPRPAHGGERRRVRRRVSSLRGSWACPPPFHSPELWRPLPLAFSGSALLLSSLSSISIRRSVLFEVKEAQRCRRRRRNGTRHSRNRSGCEAAADSRRLV